MTSAAPSLTLEGPYSSPDHRSVVPHLEPQSPGLTVASRYDVAIVGMGYVGLPTALAFHAAGHRVLGFDVSSERLAAIKLADVDLVPDDVSRLRDALDDAERFVLADDSEQLALAAGVVVCVPTPVDEHLVPDLSILSAACRTLVARAAPGQTLVLTSTTYVGSTNDLLTVPLAERGFTVGEDIFVAFSAERIDPGSGAHAHEDVPRVIGGVTAKCSEHAQRLLARYAKEVHPVSTAEAAELTKLYENSFRAVNIALANEFSDICRVLSLDVREVIRAAATKPYGFMAFHPGPGVGGHCIPCDPHYLLWQLRSRRVNAPLLETAMTAVALRPQLVVTRAREVLADRGRPLEGARVLVHGVAYKPGVADLRESPALQIIASLRDAGADVAYTDRLVPSMAGELCMDSVPRPADTAWDLVIAHTVHPGDDVDWLHEQLAVLDATYGLEQLSNRELP